MQNRSVLKSFTNDRAGAQQIEGKCLPWNCITAGL